MPFTINIDTESGFCFGVVKAIETVERELALGGPLWCIGQIVHNAEEVARLKGLGMNEISVDKLFSLQNAKVLIRAHGEPPSTYRIAEKQNLQVIDATCPLVLRLQADIKKAAFEMARVNGQVVIYGKRSHPEVIGLAGNAGDNYVVVEQEGDMPLIDFTRPVRLFSQTTMDVNDYRQICSLAEKECERNGNRNFKVADSSCRQVSRRKDSLAAFAVKYRLVLFVSGRNSSNGKILFDHCCSVNANTKFITNPDDLSLEWFSGIESVGITGATSTPRWLMEKVAASVVNIIESSCI